MRHSILRAGFIAALLAFAATAQAGPNVCSSESVSRTVRAIGAAPLATPAAPTWMIAALLEAFATPAGVTLEWAAPVDAAVAEHQPPAKPHQNPAFPAAFVFQSNSSLFLAADLAPAAPLPAVVAD